METTKRSTFKLLFYLKKSTLKKNGMVSVMGRITINGKVAQFSTKVDINPGQWDLKYGRVSGKSREAVSINEKLDSIRLRVETCYNKILNSEGIVTAEKLKSISLGMDSGQQTFLKFFEAFNKDFEKKVDSGTRVLGTLRKYRALLNHLKDFIPKKYKTTDIAFHEVNCEFVQDFDYYLRSDLGKDHNTIWMYMIGLVTITKLAIKRKLLPSNPFDEYKNTLKEKDRGYLLKKELEELIAFQPYKKRYEFLKDLFVFSCFTGLAYSDIKQLEKSHIQDFFDGNAWIIKRRKKTVTSSNVMLLDIPRRIIEKYAGITRDNRLFAVPTNETCNRALRMFAKEIPCLKGKKVTFHLARHTFATLFLSEGVPLESISKMMGHKKISTTQIYAKIVNEKVGRDMQKVSHNFKGLEAAFSG